LIFNDLRHEILNLILKSQTLFLFFLRLWGFYHNQRGQVKSFFKKLIFIFFDLGVAII
tara:strand:- start:2402 stop:2575 length:174 start_codon:yes stop_codon:yes gene_type:complete